MSKKRKSNRSSHASSSRRRPASVQKAWPKWWFWAGLGLAVIIIVVVAVLLWPKPAQAAGITAAQAFQKYQQGTFVLDVRTQDEWDEKHISNTTLIPLDELSDRINELPKDEEIVVVCRSGNRSKQAVKILSEAGITNAASVSGGINAWQSAGYPIESAAP